MRQAHNTRMLLEDNNLDVRYVIRDRDRDRKFPDEFDRFWKDEEVRVIRSPIKAPKANAFSESIFASLKRECLNYFMCFSRERLDHPLKVRVRHYHKERPHRGVGRNYAILDETFLPRGVGVVKSRLELGGIIRHYYRDIA